MTEQMTLERLRWFVRNDRQAAGIPRRSLDDEFSRWMRTKHGQEVYQAVVSRAFRLRRRGVTHYGVGAICEAIRYSWTVARGPETWKVNNNWRSRLARLAMSEHAELDGFFETRSLRS